MSPENKTAYVKTGKLFAEAFLKLNRGEQRKLTESDNPQTLKAFYICTARIAEAMKDKDKVSFATLNHLIKLLGAGITHSDDRSSLGTMLRKCPKLHVARVEQLFASESLEELIFNLDKVLSICKKQQLDFDRLYWDLLTFDNLEHRQRILAGWAKDYWY